MSELKPGESLDFTVGDKTLTIEALPYGNIKKILKLVLNVSDDMAVKDMKGIPAIIDKYLGDIFPLLFVKGKYTFITSEWIEDTMTIPALRKMLEAAIVVNGLQDFFEKLTGKTTVPAPSMQATPPEKVGSTIASGLVMDGDPKTSTS